jgi:hypothetical protein
LFFISMFKIAPNSTPTHIFINLWTFVIRPNLFLYFELSFIQPIFWTMDPHHSAHEIYTQLFTCV